MKSGSESSVSKMVQLNSRMLWVLQCSSVRASLALVWSTVSRAAAEKFHFSFMPKLILTTVCFSVLNVNLFLPWHVLLWHSRNDGFNGWTPAKHSSVCLHSSSSVIFLQRVLFPLPHKSLSCAPRMYTNSSEFKTVIFSVLTEQRGADRGNLRERSLCFLDPWGQGQEISWRTVHHSGAKVFFCWKNDAWDALVFLGRSSFTRIVHNSLSGYWWQAWTEANWTVVMV